MTMFKLTIPIDASDHVIGPSDASVTIVEYGDFECPICKQAAPVVKLLLHHFEGRIRFSYRHFPLREVHQHALRAAEAAESAGVQGKFWPMHDLLFDSQQHLTTRYLRRYAERLQLDMARYMADMDDSFCLQRIRAHVESGLASGVRATPTFFVNNEIVDVSFGLHQLSDAIELGLQPSN